MEMALINHEGQVGWAYFYDITRKLFFLLPISGTIIIESMIMLESVICCSVNPSTLLILNENVECINSINLQVIHDRMC